MIKALKTIESAREYKDMYNSTLTNPKLRDWAVIVDGPANDFVVCTSGFAVCEEMEVIK